MTDPDEGERLQKLIAQAGLASRRKAEQLITEGRVRVNGQVVTELGSRADAARDRIEVDGKRLSMPKAWTYIVLNKPAGVVTTASDEFDRKTVLELLKGVEARVYPVGRLDLDAEGVLLLTNDGQLAAALTHPSGGVEKTYRAKVKGQMTDDAINRLRTGVVLEDGPAIGTNVHRVQPGHQDTRYHTWVELTVTEGRNHLIKRMFEALGHPVIRLRRMRFAHLDAADLRAGQWRHLRREELRKLQALARGARRRREDRRKSKQPD
ncbi:MAG: rRNA pseudouridine synthase [Myxococcales bacterium]|nr:rRNA pseudouridine synthase [Myxococcales bacterium]